METSQINQIICLEHLIINANFVITVQFYKLYYLIIFIFIIFAPILLVKNKEK